MTFPTIHRVDCQTSPSILSVTTASFSSLHRDLQLLILHLLAPRELCNFELAAKKIGQLTPNDFNSQWEHFYKKKFGKYGVVAREGVPFSFKEACLHTVNLSRRLIQLRHNPDKLVDVLYRYNKSHSLSITKRNYINSITFLMIANAYCFYLQKLSIKKTERDFDPSENSDSDPFTGHHWLEVEDLKMLLRLRPSLQSLTLQACPTLSSLELNEALSLCGNLRSVSITSDNVTNDTFFAIASRNPHLERLRIAGQCNFDGGGLLYILIYRRQMINLKKIDIEISHFGVGVDSSAALNFFTQMNGLQELTFHACGSVNDQMIEAIAESNRIALRQLNLGGCKLVTTQAISALAAHCPNLASLALNEIEDEKTVVELKQEVQSQKNLGHFAQLSNLSIRGGTTLEG